MTYIPIPFKTASFALELLSKCFSVSALMADGMGKINMSEPCVNSSVCAASVRRNITLPNGCSAFDSNYHVYRVIVN